MSRDFDERRDSAILRNATSAFVGALLADVLPDLRLAARGLGYAVAVHGSEARDIDLVAIPWDNNAAAPKALVDRICGVLAGKLGRATSLLSDWSEKPHGRQAVTIIVSGGALCPEFDLSIMPRIGATEE